MCACVNTCHWSLIFQRLKLYAFFSFSTETMAHGKQYKHTLTLTQNIKNLKTNEKIWHTFVLCCSDINKQVVYAKNKNDYDSTHMFRKHWIQGNAVESILAFCRIVVFSIAEDALLFVYFSTTTHTRTHTTLNWKLSTSTLRSQRTTTFI